MKKYSILFGFVLLLVQTAVAQSYPIYTKPSVINNTGQVSVVNETGTPTFDDEPDRSSTRRRSSSSSEGVSDFTQRILDRRNERESDSGLSNFTLFEPEPQSRRQNILDREPSGNFQSVNIQLGDCTNPEPIESGIFGPIPDTAYCNVFGPVPKLEDYFPRGS